ncbi:MAG: hypothetical protein ABFD07_00450 [Methanobacterium sp.]
MENCSQGNISLNKTFIISSTPVIPVIPCSAYTTNLLFSCDGSKTFTFSGNTITPYKDTVPESDGQINIGTPIRRFRDVNTISGTSTVWTSTNVVNTPNLNLGFDSMANERIITANNSVIEDDILLGGDY